MKRDAGLPWRKRVRKAVCYGALASILVSAALVGVDVAVPDEALPLFTIIGFGLFAGVAIFLLAILGFVRADTYYSLWRRKEDRKKTLQQERPLSSGPAPDGASSGGPSS